MEANRFPMEYIGYLQEKNSDLVDKLNEMKEMYEKKIFMKDMNRQYLLSLMKDALNVCTELPQEIDVFFEEMSSAMNTLKNILLKKSEMLQLAEKISQVIKPQASKLEPQNPEYESYPKTRKKNCAVKVSPMINGHVILTEPRIYLNRISKNVSPLTRRESQPLSPIVEVSPAAMNSPTSDRNNYSNLIESSTPRNVRHSVRKRNSPRNQNTPKTPATKTSSNQSNEREQEENNPLEGPSWLLNDMQFPECFVNIRRRRHRFAERFDKLNKKINERMTIDEKHRKSTSQENFSHCETNSSVEEEKKVVSKKKSAKKSGPRGKRPTKKHSKEFIEGTPEKEDSKEDVLKLISIKQPLVTLEDCMRNKSFRQMISKTRSDDSSSFGKKVKEECISSNETSNSLVFEEEKYTGDESSSGKKKSSEENSGDMFIGEDSTSKTHMDQPEEPISINELINEIDGYDKGPNSDRNSIKPLDESSHYVSIGENNTLDRLVLNDVLDKVRRENSVNNEMTDIMESLSRNTGEKSAEIEEAKIKSETCESGISNNNLFSENKSEDGNASDRSNGSSTYGREPRKKRRAAPTNLCEPSLQSKLRRD